MTAATAPSDASHWIESLGDPSWLIDAASLRVETANAAAATLLRTDLAALAGSDAACLLPTLEDHAFWADVRSGRHGRLESQAAMQFADGRLLHIHRRIVPLPAAGQPAPLQYLVQLRDRTEEHRNERERATLLAELRGTLEATSDAILVTDLSGRIQAFNRRFAELWNLPPAALASRDDEGIYQWMRLATLKPEEYQRRLDQIQEQMLLECTDAVALLNGAWIERHTGPQWSEGRPIGRVFCFREANHHRPGAPRNDGAQGEDEATRLPNRTGFLQLVEDAMRDARASTGWLAVLCIEFDNQMLFGLGSDATPGSGARSMAELAAGIRSCLRGPHLLSRIAAARFAVLIRGSGEEAAEAIARRLIEAMRPGGPTTPTLTNLPLAIGIAAYPDAGLGAADLLRNAEAALRAAQHDGRPSWRIYRMPAEIDLHRQQRLEHDVRHGMNDHAFRLRLQARFDPNCGRLSGLQAGLRWRDQARGDVAPAQFRQLALRAGLQGALDDWLLERALRAVQLWQRRHHGLVLAVGVCGWQLVQPGYARRVAAVLATAGWPAAQLELEVTEEALRADPDAALAALAALDKLGVRVVLEGYGRPDGSWGPLQRYPLKAVKLDPALLRSVPGHEPDARRVAAMIGIAQASQLAVYAEGVHTPSQLAWLAGAGCAGYTGTSALTAPGVLQAPAAAPAAAELLPA